MVRSRRPADSALAFSARAWCHLLFRFLLTHLSNPGAHRSDGNSTCGNLPASSGSIAWSLAASMVCADGAVVVEWAGHAECAVLGRYAGLPATDAESMAARHAGDLFCVLPFICGGRSGFLRLPVRWNVAGGRIHFVIFCACGTSAGVGHDAPCFPCQPVSVAMGMVSHLLRIWCSENSERRSRVAAFNCHG